MSALSSYATMEGLSVDSLEQHVYVARKTNPLDVVRLGADTGAIVDAQRQ